MSYYLLLISMDSEIGELRRSRLNWTPHGRIIGKKGDEAPEAFRRRFRFMHTARDSSRRGIVGCAWSHICALQKIADEDLRDVIILEDDAKLVGPLPPLSLLPQDAIVHLGGALRTPGTWARQRQEFPPEREAEIWHGLREGLNPLEGFSIVGAEAYYVPNAKVATRILCVADAPDVRMLHWDLFMRSRNLAPLLWFPNSFSASDEGHSQVEGRALLRHLYAAGPRKIRAREAAMRARREMEFPIHALTLSPDPSKTTLPSDADQELRQHTLLGDLQPHDLNSISKGDINIALESRRILSEAESARLQKIYHDDLEMVDKVGGKTTNTI
jgi:hypothetical protein